MKCPKCNKPIRENTEGNKRYCQGHSIFENTLRCLYCHQEAKNQAGLNLHLLLAHNGRGVK